VTLAWLCLLVWELLKRLTPWVCFESFVARCSAVVLSARADLVDLVVRGDLLSLAVKADLVALVVKTDPLVWVGPEFVAPA
jgi:hypothetical protein